MQIYAVTTLNFLRKDTRVPLLIATLFGLLLILNVIATIKIFISDQNTSLTPPNSHLYTLTHTPANIANLHLFGEYKENVADLPKTRLHLNLQGIEFSVASKNKSRALISTPGKPIKIYKIGDKVSGGAIIRNIRRDQVILENNGHLESLNLPIPKISGIMTSAVQ